MAEVGSIDKKDYNALDQVEVTLPISWYYDPRQYQTELEKIWYHKWIYFCRSETLEVNGFKTLTIGDQNVWITKTQSGKINGYLNNCRHRGSLLLTEAEGKLKNNLVTCPYHRWSYSSEDGHLLATSSHCPPDSFQKSDYGLYKIAVHNWRGFIFINLNPDAEWTEEVFFGGNEEVRNYPLEKMVWGRQWKETIACNWKTFWDNFNECLHCPGVHPSLSKLVPIYGRGLQVANDLPNWKEHTDNPDPRYRGGIRDGSETWSLDGSSQGYAKTDGLSEEDLKRQYGFGVVLPATYIVTYADHVRIARFLPLGPELIDFQMDWLFHPEALEDPNYDMSNVTEFEKTVVMEDGAACVLTQKGMHARPFKEGVLMPEEYELQAFKQWLLKALD